MSTPPTRPVMHGPTTSGPPRSDCRDATLGWISCGTEGRTAWPSSSSVRSPFQACTSRRLNGALQAFCRGRPSATVPALFRPESNGARAAGRGRGLAALNWLLGPAPRWQPADSPRWATTPMSWFSSTRVGRTIGIIHCGPLPHRRTSLSVTEPTHSWEEVYLAGEWIRQGPKRPSTGQPGGLGHHAKGYMASSTEAKWSAYAAGPESTSNHQWRWPNNDRA